MRTHCDASVAAETHFHGAHGALTGCAGRYSGIALRHLRLASRRESDANLAALEQHLIHTRRSEVKQFGTKLLLKLLQLFLYHCSGQRQKDAFFDDIVLSLFA